MKTSRIDRNDRIPFIMNLSDFFKCQNPSCGYTIRKRVLGNTARCSQCGGTMRRI